jgi:hypothetical protein
MEKREFEDLVIRAAEIFTEPVQEVYSVPRNYPLPYPRIYVPVNMKSAACMALEEAGMISPKPEDLELMNDVAFEAMEIVEEVDRITQRRNRIAYVLNHYSVTTEFNPN